MARLNISMNNEMVKDIEKKAENEGKTVSSYITEAIKGYGNIKAAGLQKEDIDFMLKYVNIFMSIGAVPVPAFLLDEITRIAFSKSSDTVSSDIIKPHALALYSIHHYGSAKNII